MATIENEGICYRCSELSITQAILIPGGTLKGLSSSILPPTIIDSDDHARNHGLIFPPMDTTLPDSVSLVTFVVVFLEVSVISIFD
ncbi:hypothetical protein BJY52DRAFT_1199755 [Lactarius psammicola]|nr:hypothetical protein BJY52DRAFT_1199755 [Lactarius psammicola]